MRINHNISALNTRRHLVTNTQAQAKNLERLSSGLKINRGADGPAQLIISERLRTQQASLKQAIDNNEAGVTVLQTAEGALSEASRSLIHIRELAVHAANEAVNDEFMLQADQQEIDHRACIDVAQDVPVFQIVVGELEQHAIMRVVVRGTAFGGASGRTDVPKIVDWYMDGKIEIDPMITHKLSLDEINHGFHLMHEGKSIRAVIEF